MLFKKLRFLSLVLVLGFSQHLYSQNVGKTSLNVSATGSKFASTVTPVPATTTPVQGCDEPEPDPCDGNTFTQGAWGAGNNNPASTYLNSYFSTYFPNGLTIGCGSRQLKLTSAAAVFAFLPSGSTPAILPTGTLTNPGGAYSNVLAGQLVALTLNMGFDANNAGFSPSAHSLANYTITSGTFSGMSVSAFLNLANSIIGGCSSQYSYSQLNTAATAINENYDNNSSNGFLVCPPVCNITVTAVSGSISCFSGNTNVTITATGGTAPYTGTGVFSRPAGVHSFTVSDIYGCQSVKTKTLTQPSQLVATASNGSISCYGGTASICVNASGGTPPYSGTGTFTRTAGVHSFTVTDSKGCTSVVSKVLTQPAQINVSATNGSISCYGGTATICVNASGGTAPYSGTGTFTRTAGVHSFTVTDNKGCTAVITRTLTQPAQLIVSATNGSISCYGGTATICVNASGGTAPYTGTGTFTRTTGIHSFTVTDYKGCTAVITKTLTQPSQLLATASNGSIFCYGGTATICVNASGGTPPYSGTGTFTRAAGIHTFIVTDSKGCTAVLTKTLTEPAQLTVTATNGIISCYGGTATICINATGGSAPYTGTGTFTRTAGVHSFTVTDNKGCASVITKTLSQPTPLTVSATNGTISCYGGTATICVNASGGTAPYTGTGTFTRTAGVHSFTVTDSNGCTAIVTKTITQVAPLNVSINSSNGTCNNSNLGSSTLIVTGGSAPYSYLWSNTATTSVINGLSAGTYTAWVTDANACTGSSTTSISVVACCNVTSPGSISGSTTSCGSLCNLTFGSNAPAS
ncbi:MAG: SprB repeat-containing protein, partial [Bacteroidia bacterium]|nr:SprB repeat-containing protein [Bacteroidia bacterium]